VTREERFESFSGPLPHPDHFRKYNQTVAGSANRLLKMVEDDLMHRHYVQKKQTNIEAFAVVIGLIAGTIIALVALIGSGYLIIKGHDTVGAILGTGSLGSLVSVFIYGKITKNNS